MQPSIRTILATTEIFDNFTDSQLTLLAALCAPVTYDQGHVVLTENDQSDDLYIIGRGGVEVLVNPSAVGPNGVREEMEPVVLTELRQGQVVGEVALVDQGVRSATSRPRSPNTCRSAREVQSGKRSPRTGMSSEIDDESRPHSRAASRANETIASSIVIASSARPWSSIGARSRETPSVFGTSKRFASSRSWSSDWFQNTGTTGMPRSAAATRSALL